MQEQTRTVILSLLLIVLGITIGVFLTWDYLNVTFAHRLIEYQNNLQDQCSGYTNFTNTSWMQNYTQVVEALPSNIRQH